jgi:hypothetical protein
MSEFTDRCSVDVSAPLARILGLENNMIVKVEARNISPFKQNTPILVIQGHNESFGKIKNIKSELENLFLELGVVMESVVYCIQDEPFNVKINTEPDQEVSLPFFACTCATFGEMEVKVDFTHTVEYERKKREAIKLAEIKQLPGFEDVCDLGNTLGGNVVEDIRQARLRVFKNKGL